MADVVAVAHFLFYSCKHHKALLPIMGHSCETPVRMWVHFIHSCIFHSSLRCIRWLESIQACTGQMAWKHTGQVTSLSEVKLIFTCESPGSLDLHVFAVWGKAEFWEQTHENLGKRRRTSGVGLWQTFLTKYSLLHFILHDWLASLNRIY